MRLSRSSTYAVHAVVYMAQKGNGKLITSHDIAKGQGMPERFLVKLLRPLVNNRVLMSLKGPNGGYRLARPASSISLLEIVEAVDGSIRGFSPFAGGKQTGGLDNRLEKVCNDAAQQLRDHLSKVSISELAARKK
jgi:Rrf2 family protein